MAANTPQSSEPALLLRVDATTARLLGLRTSKSVYRWIADGTIPSAAVMRVGAAIYLRRQVLVEWVGNDAQAKRHPR